MTPDRSILTIVWKAALATLLCLGLLSACDSDPTEPRTAAAPDRPSSLVHNLAWSPVVLADGCPPVGQRLLFPPGGGLPHGANVVRLCNGYGTSKDVLPYDVPEDMLITDVDRLIDQINHLKPLPPTSDHDIFCPMDGGRALTFWFGYPDGTAAAVVWHPFGCQLLRMGPGLVVEGGGQVLAEYARSLARQRREDRFPTNPPAPQCDPREQPVSPLGPSALDLSAVRICGLGRPGLGQRVTVDVVRRMNRERFRGQGRGCVEPRGRVWLRAMTVGGDHFDFYPAGCRWTLPTQAGDRDSNPTWRPSRALARSLTDLWKSQP